MITAWLLNRLQRRFSSYAGNPATADLGALNKAYQILDERLNHWNGLQRGSAGYLIVWDARAHIKNQIDETIKHIQGR
jgi:hypothetical protein